MKYVIAAVRDAKSELFGRPFFTQGIGTAMRSFEDEVNRNSDDNTMHHHPDDFSLWHLGYYEDTDGTFEVNPPKMLSTAREAIGPKSKI